MLDFMTVASRVSKQKTIEVYPKFMAKNSNDIMIRGRTFYAVWNEYTGLWSTSEDEAAQLIDRAVEEYAVSHKAELEAKYPSATGGIVPQGMWDCDAGIIDKWHKYCQKQMWDNYHPLDETLIFANTEVKQTDYSSKRLPYALVEGRHDAWDELVGTLYEPSERTKIEWAIGAIVTGDSKNIQKFVVFYGSFGTGKSTVLNIIRKLFEGYTATFDSKALGSASNAFALEAFRSNPLVGIQDDGDLSRIEDNTKINSLVSHETMLVNEKFKQAYPSRFNTFLLMGTNKPVKITDAKSGLLRRLIDVTPSGNRIPNKHYLELVEQVNYELGAIAAHCRDLYLKNKHLYDDYRPLAMMGATNDFYLFVYDKYYVFKQADRVALDDAWTMYKAYCEDAKVNFMYPKRQFREELKNYFRDFTEHVQGENGERLRNIYSGFRTDRFEQKTDDILEPTENSEPSWLVFENIESIFDRECHDCPAQYANDDGVPSRKWENNTTILSELDTSKLHYVKIPLNHIVIDFDIPDENGDKCLRLNVEAAKKLPPTYAELSKSGQGIHLHYIYDGDPKELSAIYDEHIEIKVFKGGSSLRRKLSQCNRLTIGHISSGLPLKEAKKVLDSVTIKDETHLRRRVEKNLRKECVHYTKPSIDLILKDLDKAYESGMVYDLTDMIDPVMSLAMSSTHNAEYCVKQVGKMHFKSKAEPADVPFNEDEPIAFFDVEVFIDLFVVCWKLQGEDKPVNAMINPTPMDILKLAKFKLIGFNNRKYDNHILYARIQNYSNEELYKLSQRIISGDRTALFGQAYNMSYTDIFDFSSTKQSLKKFEIEIGIHHQELGMPWDKPVPENMWEKVAEYCKNDVIATEATFNYLASDWFGRELLVKMANKLCPSITSTVNDTTNTLTARIVFNGNKNPQSQFNYRDLSKPVRWDESMRERYRKRLWPIFDDKGQPTYQRFDPDNPIELPEGYSIMPFWPDYSFDPTRKEKSLYLGQEVGEGGRVYAQPGMYGNSYLDDITSMHPSTIEAEDVFGPVYTQNYADLKQIRIDIKHNDIAAAKSRLGGALAELFEEENFAPKKVSKGLKIPINAAYGQTAAHFVNPFRDPRNVDNIVAKRGALFMMNLEQEVKKRGYTVAHIKTDSIKIPDADEEIMSFVEAYGREYGYNFEHEATYEKMCLVNNAVYVAKYKWAEDKDIKPGTWTATGTQFKVPYVFKTLFSHEPLTFDDYCITQESKVGALYLDYGTEEKHDYQFVGKVGQFTPVKQDGGILVAQRTDKKTGEITYAAAPGTTGYRWTESEKLRGIDMAKKDEIIDISYFKAQDNAAVEAIEQYGQFSWFVSDEPYDRSNNGILPF